MTRTFNLPSAFERPVALHIGELGEPGFGEAELRLVPPSVEDLEIAGTVPLEMLLIAAAGLTRSSSN